MNRPLLTAALIVRDEADHLRRCLASIRPVVDEIVVVDTGSVDDSPDVARAFGAVVDVFAWTGQFAPARNHALDLATGEWILYVDADEELAPIDPAAFRRPLTDPSVVAVRPLLKARSNWSPYREYRLFRNRPDVRFTGTIHESMVADVVRIAAAEGLRIEDHPDPRALLIHHGYEGDQTRKHLRNLPLLEEQVRHAPERVYLWDHLGRVHADLGHREEADDAWMHGIALVRANGPREAVDCLPYFDLILALVAERSPEAVERARVLADEAEAAFPGNPLVQWAAALAAMTAGDLVLADARLVALLDGGRERAAVDALALDERLFGHVGWDTLGSVRYALGDNLGAADAWAQAYALEGSPEYRAKVAAARLRAAVADAPAAGPTGEA